MSIKIKMFSDYICPFCYLGKAIIDKLKKQYKIDLEHVGIEIHPETPTCGLDLSQYIPQTNEMYQQLRDRGKQYGINFCDLKVLVNSRKALIIGEYAKTLKKNEEYTNEIFKAYFEECQDIAKKEVIVAVAEKIGLIKAQIEVALADQCSKKHTKKIVAKPKNKTLPEFLHLS